VDEMKTINKIIVISLDGCDWKIIKPFIKNGFLPTLQKVIKGGVSGSLRSCFPPITWPAWESICAGKKPNSHGYYGSMELDRDYNLRVVEKRRNKKIWDFLGFHGLRSIIINIPLTYPPEKINGVIVPGMDTPKEKSDIVEPRRYQKFLKSIKYEIEPLVTRDKDKLLNNIMRVMEKRFKVIEKFIETKWDFFMFLIRGTDVAQHFLWEDENKILNVYKKIDKFIDEILTEDTNVFIISDHGFGKIKKKVYINSLLKKIGVLSLKPTKRYKILKRLGIQRRFFAELINKFQFLRKKLSTKILSQLSGFLPEEELDLSFAITNKLIDWQKTKAIAVNNFGCGIYINSINRFANGIVKANEYESFKIKLKGGLNSFFKEKNLALKVVEFSTVFPKVNGSHTPDLIIVNKSDDILPATEFNDKIVENVSEVEHYMDGILIAYGPDIKKGRKIVGAKIIDIAPTILHMFNLPIPKDMDGKVLKKIFKSNSNIFKRKIKYVNSGYYNKDSRHRKIRTRKLEEKIIKKRLKALGYF
jgi:predicted AlkP superfamily phosphohydrolase/phosphomutase